MVCTAGEFEALLVNDKDAEAAPLAPGVKVTVKVADWPAAIVAGSEIPESTNSLLLILADETVTDAPLAVRLPLSGALDPSTTLPKLRLVGDTAKVPAAVPVPESAMPSGDLGALEVKAALPLELPVDCGAKATEKVALCPVPSVSGKVKPPRVKLAPVRVA